MDAYLLTWIIVTIVLAIAFMVMLALYIRCESVKMNPSECLSLAGDFAVVTDQDSNTLVACDGPCEFLVSSVNEAFEICMGHFELCPLYIQMSRTRLETVAIPAVGEAGRRQTLKTCS